MGLIFKREHRYKKLKQKLQTSTENNIFVSRSFFYYSQGLTNGNGFVNGNGLTDGNGLTNGNGLIISKLPIGQKINNANNQKYAKIGSIIARNRSRKVLEILVCITILLLPLVLYLWDFDNKTSGRIFIDGEFGDWDGVEKHEDDPKDQIENVNVNILEYQINNDALHYYFYLKVYGRIFNGVDIRSDIDINLSAGIDTLHIFIDTDNDANSGYAICNLRSEYMLEINGYQNDILDSSVYRFEDKCDKYDWSGWKMISHNIDTGIKGKYLEIQIPTNLLGNPKNSILAFLYLRDSLGHEDYSDRIMSSSGNILSIKQRTINTDILDLNSKGNNILELELLTEGTEVNLKSLTFQLIGNTKSSDIVNVSLYHEDEKLADGQIINEKIELKFQEPLTLHRDSTEQMLVKLDISKNAKCSRLLGLKMDSEKSLELEQEVPVIIDSEISLKYIGEVPQNIVIDGAFGDWYDVPGHIDADLDVIRNKNIDVNEFRTAFSSETLSFYFDVKGKMMSGTFLPIRPKFIEGLRTQITSKVQYKDQLLNSERELEIVEQLKEHMPPQQIIGVDTAYIFLDTDYDDLTGYQIEGTNVGADYMIIITGKNGEILTSTIQKYVYPKPHGSIYISNTNIWSWELVEIIPAANSNSKLEASVKSSVFPESDVLGSGVRLYYYFEDWYQIKDDSIKSFKITEEGLNSDMPKSIYQGPSSRGSENSLKKVTSFIGNNTNDNLGWSVANAGDVNNDGFDDIIAGAPGMGKSTGCAYIFFGGSWFSGELSVSRANITLLGMSKTDNFGWSVTGDCDINADGYSDVMIGAPNNASSRGAVYIFYGSDIMDRMIYANSANVTILGENIGDKFGYSISSTGDINADKINDIIIGAPEYNNYTGKAYIFYGTGGGLNDVVASDSGNQVHIFKGTNSGTWLPRSALDVGSLPISVVIKDANNDGINDLISADYYSNAVSVFNGTINNVFAPRSILKVGTTPRCLSVADANNDGLNDIVTVNEVDNTLTIYNGTLSTGWESKCVLPVGKSPRSIFIGDANNDGKNDLITADADDDTVTIYNGTGTGVWEPKMVLNVGKYPTSVVVADINGDTYNDIITADRYENTITIFNGTSNNDWEPKFNLSVGNEPFYVCANDANNDGYIDILTADKNDNNVSIFNGTSTGELENRYCLRVGSSPRSVFVGDANNDGFNDILTADYIDNTISIYNGTISGNWEERSILHTGNWPYSVFVGDLNSANFYGIINADKANSFILGNTKDGKFGGSVSNAGDINGDGYDDIIIGAPGENRSYLYFGNERMGLKTNILAGSRGSQDSTSETNTADLRLDDDLYYIVGKQKVMLIKSFNITGLFGELTSVQLRVQYKTDSSYTPDKYIEWSTDSQTFENTSLKVLQSTLETTPKGYDLFNQGVDTLNEIMALNIRFQNSDSGGQCNVHFDYIWLEITTRSPRARVVLNGTGELGWAVSNAGDVNGDNLSDIIVGAPDISGSTPGNAYLKFGNHQCFDNETVDQRPNGYNWVGSTGNTNALVNDTKYYGGGGNCIKFFNSGTSNYAGIYRMFSPANNGIFECFVLATVSDSTKLSIKLTSGGTTSGNEACWLTIGSGDSPNNQIICRDGSGSYSFTIISLMPFQVDIWYKITIVFDCLINSFDVYINDELKISNSGFIVNHDTLDTIVLIQEAGEPAHVEYIDDVVWLSSNFDINLTGSVNGDQFGYSVSGAGDINNDGYDDIIIGAPFNDSAMGNINDAGAVYVFYIKDTTNFMLVKDAVNISYGERSNNHFGFAVSEAGYVNGDKFLDVIIGAPNYDDNLELDVGKIYILSYDIGQVIPEFPILGIPIILISMTFIILRKRRKVDLYNSNNNNFDPSGVRR